MPTNGTRGAIASSTAPSRGRRGIDATHTAAAETAAAVAGPLPTSLVLVLGVALTLLLAGPVAAASTTSWNELSSAEILESVSERLGLEQLRASGQPGSAGIQLLLLEPASPPDTSSVSGVVRFSSRRSAPPRVAVLGVWGLRHFELPGPFFRPGFRFERPTPGVSPIPEPGAALLFGAGVILAGGVLGSRRSPGSR